MTTTPEAAPSPQDSGFDVNLPLEAREVIGRKLRETYSQRLSDPVPDKITDLLKALASKGE